MNRWTLRHAREALVALAAALPILGGACSPNNSVKPGAPVLIEMIIYQGGTTATTILPTTPDCPTADGGPAGASCLPQGQMADADAGTDAIPPDTLCHAAATNDWCTCAAGDPMKPNEGSWGCSPFANTSAVIAIFDRLLDTAPFDAADGGPSQDAATMTVGAGAPTAPTLLADYTSNGSTTGLIFPLLGHFVFGNFRVDGPSLFMMPDTTFPAGTTVGVVLNPLVVRAKDKTGFKAEGALAGGTIAFNTAPFIATITPPPAVGDASADVAPDNTPATIDFSSAVDATMLATHVTVTAAPGGAVAVDLASMDGAKVTVTPKTTWPASATISITVDATTPNLLGQTLGSPVDAKFTTGAM